MKKLSILLILISFYSIGKSQVLQEQGIAGVQYKVIKGDSAVIIPRGDTICRSVNKPCLGSIVLRNTGGDSTVYIHNGTRWQKLGSSGSTDTTSLSNRINQRWTLTGNTGTDSATNRIGTTDAKPLNIATNGVVRGIVSSTGNVGIGTTTPTEKLDVDGSIKAHTGIKLEGLSGITAELSQPSGGKLSLYDNVGVETITIEGTSGTIEAAAAVTFSGLATSDTATAKPVGITSSGALKKLSYWPSGGGIPSLTTGQVGYGVAGLLGSSGRLTFSPSTGLTIDSAIYLSNSTSGVGGNIYKNGSLWLHNRGDANSIFFGIGSGTSNAGVYNYGLGYGALNANTTGAFNIAIGVEAMNIGTNHSQSIAIGNEAMKHSTNTGTNTNAIAIGSSALDSLNTGFSSIGIGKLNNVHFLSGTGLVSVGASQNWRSGDFNTLFGSDLAAATALGATGSYNTLGGGFSNFNRKSGNYNTAWGNHTLAADTIGDNNTAVGSYAGTNNNGSYNGFFGNHAGAYQTSATGKIILSTIDYGNLTNENLYSPLIIQQSFGGTGQTTTLNTDLTITQLPTGIPSGAKRLLIGSNGSVYAADTTAGGGTTYSAGYGMTLSGSTFIADSSVLITKGSTQVISGAKYFIGNNIGIGTSTPAHNLQVYGSSTNGQIVAATKNASTGAGNTYAGFRAENSSSYGLLFKTGTGYSTYNNIAANDLGFYNQGAGNISILNDAGNINFAPSSVAPTVTFTSSSNTFTQQILGSSSIRAGAASYFYFNTRSGISSPSDGNILLVNEAVTDFGRLQLGGTTSSFPSIARNGTGIDIKLADNSAYTAIQSLYDRFGSGSPESVVTAPIGAVYHRTDGGAGTSLYVKESGTGNTGWIAK